MKVIIAFMMLTLLVQPSLACEINGTWYPDKQRSLSEVYSSSLHHSRTAVLSRLIRSFKEFRVNDDCSIGTLQSENNEFDEIKIDLNLAKTAPNEYLCSSPSDAQKRVSHLKVIDGCIAEPIMNFDFYIYWCK